MRDGTLGARCEDHAQHVGAGFSSRDGVLDAGKTADLDEGAVAHQGSLDGVCGGAGGRQAEQVVDEGTLVLGTHERLADEHGADALLEVLCDVAATGDAAERAEDDAALVGGIGEARGGVHVDVKVVQVAVVDADDLGTQAERTSHLLWVVDLDEGLHAQATL